ncbi:MAG TPA: hypothetical protein VGG20_22870 [Thermoanaerobaculia bacterium]|jgi:hypothetical protein
MAINALRNQTLPNAPDWMNCTWTINQVVGISSVVQTDTIDFASPNIIMRTNSPHLAAANSRSWGTWDMSLVQPGSTTLQGVTTPDQIPFTITYSEGQLTCTLQDGSLRVAQKGRIVALSTLLGTLAGAVVGLIAHVPWAGAAAGLAASAIGSGLTIFFGGAARTGPNATWVANDGPGNRIIKTGPQSVPQPREAASA